MIRYAGLIAAAVVVVVAGAATADELHPIQATSVTLGAMNGVAYYTAETGGDRIVATLSDSGSQAFRVEATLRPGQSLVLSVPRGAGEPPIEVVFDRRGDRVFVSDAAAKID